MKAPGVSVLPLLLLTLLAGGTFWLERATQLEDANNHGKLRHDPDFIVDNFTTRRFNPDGSLQHSLTAKKMLHYSDDDTTEVTAPALVYYGRTPPMRLDAKRAWVSKDGKEVLLSDAVRMVRDASAGRPALVVTTAELRAFPDDGVARTSVPVTIVNGRSMLHGSAMEANNRTQIFALLGRAQGTIYRSTEQTP